MNITPLYVRLSIVTLLTGTTLATHAAQTPLTVTGGITPTACTIALNGGGAVEYGKVNLVNTDDFTHLAKKQLRMNIRCPAATHLAVRVDPLNQDAADWELGLQLGTTSSAHIHNLYHGNLLVGAFTLRSDNRAQWGDGVEVRGLFRRLPSQWTDIREMTWTTRPDSGYQYGWGDGRGIKPYRRIDSTLILEAVLKRRSQLPPLNAELALHATTRFQLVYL